LDDDEPGQAGAEQQARDEEVQAQAEDVVRGVDAQQFLADAPERVARHVEREGAGRSDGAPSAELHERCGQDEVPHDLVEERRVEGRVVRVGGGPVGRVDLERPRQGGWAAEQLLVEVVADAPDGLRDEQRRRGRIKEQRDVRVPAMEHPDPDRGACRDATPDAQPTLPDRERSPPVIWNLVPARREEVQASADQPGRKGPQRDLAHQRRVAAHGAPATLGDRDRGKNGRHVRKAVRMHDQRPDMNAVRRRTRNERVDHGLMMSTARPPAAPAFARANRAGTLGGVRTTTRREAVPPGMITSACTSLVP
jgi:hypothetical protein